MGDYGTALRGVAAAGESADGVAEIVERV